MYPFRSHVRSKLTDNDLLNPTTTCFYLLHLNSIECTIYLNDVELFQIYQMIYNCDENEKIYMKIHSD